MKKTLISIAAGIALYGPANAAQKCVLNMPYSYEEDGFFCTRQTSGTVEWSSLCIGRKDSSKRIDMRGIGICSDENGANNFVVQDTININTTDPSKNIHCWCKMTYPAESKWVYNSYYRNFTSSGCAAGCAKTCDDSDSSEVQPYLMKNLMNN